MKLFSALLLCVSSVTSEKGHDGATRRLQGHKSRRLQGKSGKGDSSKGGASKGGASKGGTSEGGASGSSYRIAGQGRANGRSMEGSKVGGKNDLDFVLGGDQDCRIKVVSDFQGRELTITREGDDKSNAIDDDDRIFLAELVATMIIEQGEEWDADTVPAQIERAAGLLMEWPPGFPIDYEYDRAADEALDLERIAEDAANPVPPDPPEPPANTALPPALRPGGGRTGRGRRRLIDELCGSLNTFVRSTHDDFNFRRGSDATTFFAYVSNHPSCGGDVGTWFWDRGAWRCSEPDHDPNIEFAVGNCFGRCGGGCGGDNGRGTYTRDCLDHDNCVRFGHFIASPFCMDEFLATADDAIFGDRCI